MLPLTRQDNSTAFPLTQTCLASTLRQRNCQRHRGEGSGFHPVYTAPRERSVNMLTGGRGASAKEAYPRSTRQQVNEKGSGDRAPACEHEGSAAAQGAFNA